LEPDQLPPCWQDSSAACHVFRGTVGGIVVRLFGSASDSRARREDDHAPGGDTEERGRVGFELYDRNGSIVASNDNWKDGPNAAEIRSSGLTPSKDAESAILATLPRGAYTAIVRSNGDMPTGVALVEVYNLSNE